MDVQRLSVRLALGEYTGVRGPHLVPDVLYALRDTDVRVLSYGSSGVKLSVNAQDVHLEWVSRPEGEDMVVSVTCNGKVVYLDPTREVDAPTHLVDMTDKAHDVMPFLYDRWAMGLSLHDKDVIASAYGHHLKVTPGKWRTNAVRYVEPFDIVLGIRVVLETSSVA